MKDEPTPSAPASGETGAAGTPASPKSGAGGGAGGHKAAAFYLLALALLALDQWTKHLALAALEGGRVVSIIPGYLVLNLVHNRGSAFGLFQGGALPLAVVGLVAVGVIIYIERRGLPGNLLRIAVALQLGGAIGNLVDRLRLGYVTDFIELDWKGHNIWPVFNIADSAITIGTLLLVIWLLRSDAGRQSSPPIEISG